MTQHAITNERDHPLPIRTEIINALKRRDCSAVRQISRVSGGARAESRPTLRTGAALT
jgi:hypothetical protein